MVDINQSPYSSIWGKILRKWDWWVYRRAFHSLRRMAINNPGMSYLMELNIREWNEELNIPDGLKRSAELFHESFKRHE
jgi:hypothetical protein